MASNPLKWFHGSFTSSAVDDPRKVVKVVAQDGRSGETRDLAYTNCKVIGNGSFGIVFQAKLLDEPSPGSEIAIKKVLQDKRFKVRSYLYTRPLRAGTRHATRPFVSLSAAAISSYEPCLSLPHRVRVF